jgi:hypothetical protein
MIWHKAKKDRDSDEMVCENHVSCNTSIPHVLWFLTVKVVVKIGITGWFLR